jgi:peptidoglycan/xylan/chitin deacetylase (PgdA/CDA1 family)
MFYSESITGCNLPLKTVCLTFDDGPGVTTNDGPGPRTLEIARFLYERSIPATFFVIGEFAATHKSILQKMIEMGHLIGNHSWSHVSLKGRDGQSSADEEIISTDEVINEVAHPPLKLLRPPYGDWDSNVAGQLNWTTAHSYIGPIMWDIEGRDWHFWLTEKNVQSCACAYIKSINQSARGVILFHDCSKELGILSNMWPLELIQIVVDWLQQNNFRFIRADSIPQVEDAASISSVIALQTHGGHYISPQLGGGGAILAGGTSIGAWEPLGVKHLDNNDPSKIALRCLNGSYVSPQQGGGGAILANGSAANEWETLTWVDVGTDFVALQCQSGHFISAQQGNGGEIRANGRSIGDWEVFRVLKAPE